MTKNVEFKTHRYDGARCAGSQMSAYGYFHGG